MKLKPLFLIFSFILLLFSQCRKHKTEQLPPETQTGAGTFGFTIDGKVYKANFPDVLSTYMYITTPYSNGYFFTLSGGKLNKWGIIVLTDSLKIEQGNNYSLSNYRNTPGTAYAKYGDYNKEYYTKPNLQGELMITKLDSINRIVSGTFWFDAIDTLSNTTVNIRDGRFDLHYTQ